MSNPGQTIPKKGQTKDVTSTQTGKTTGKGGVKGRGGDGSQMGVEQLHTTKGVSMDSLAYSTRIIHLSQELAPEQCDWNSIVPPIVLSTSFEKCRRGRGMSPTRGGRRVSPGGRDLSPTRGGRRVSPSEREVSPTKGGKKDEQGIIGRIADTLGMGSGRITTGNKGNGAATSDTTGTGSPEAKGALGRGETGSTSLQNTGRTDTGRTDTGGKHKKTSGETRGIDSRRGGIHGVAGEMTIPRQPVEGGIGTFASTYESSVPARGIGVRGVKTHYGRMDNPTRLALEQSLASLENANYAIAFPSGTSALTTCGFLLESGNHVLVLDEVYSDTAKFFRNCATRMGVEVSFVDMTDLNVTGGEVRPNTAVVWIETPTNPSLKIVDIQAVVGIVRRTNPNTIVIVDSTVASPMFQQPLELGADIVLHSLTKHINGHLDVVMGSLMTNRKDLAEKLRTLQDTLGLVPSPMDCYLVNRSIKTYAIRMKEQMMSAKHIASYLQNHPAVSRLMYPGLATHPHNDVFEKQMTGFGGVITFTLNGNQNDIDMFMNSLTLFSCAENLGGYVSLVEQPALTELLDENIKDQTTTTTTGITPNLIRLSIGLEDPRDLLNDLLTALQKVKPVRTTSGGIGGTDADQVPMVGGTR